MSLRRSYRNWREQRRLNYTRNECYAGNASLPYPALSTPPDAVLALFFDLIRDQQTMIKELNDRLMARSMADYGAYRQLCDAYPNLQAKLNEAVETLRAEQGRRDAYTGARNGEPRAPSIHDFADDVQMHRP